MRSLVIAYGNPLRGDDGAAWRVAAEVRRALPAVRVVAAQGLVPELADEVAAAAMVLFVDAACGDMPGAVRVAPATPTAAPAVLGHALSPAALLDLARRVYGRTPPACVVTIGGACFDVGRALSPAVEEAIATAVERIRALVGVADRG